MIQGMEPTAHPNPGCLKTVAAEEPCCWEQTLPRWALFYFTPQSSTAMPTQQQQLAQLALSRTRAQSPRQHMES